MPAKFYPFALSRRQSKNNFTKKNLPSKEKISLDATTNPLEEQFAAEQQETIKTVQVVYINDEIKNECQQPDKNETAAATLTANDDDNDDDNDKDDDDDADDLSNVSGTNDNTEAEQKAIRKASLRNGRIVFANECEYCNRYLKSKDDLIKHIIRKHDKNYYKKFPYQCHKCTKGFKSPNGLKCHLRIHGSLVFRQCPLCPSNIRDSYFATHLTKHESDTCFPCQVCGEIYTSHALRLQHWETHALEQPFGCNLCFRRYKKHQYLLKHLQSHQLYKCYFCNLEFDTPTAIIPPYTCRTCKKLRLAKKKAKQLRYMLAISQQQEDNQETQQHESSQPKDLIIFQSKTNNSAQAVTTSEVVPTSANISNEDSNTNFSYQPYNAANKHNSLKDVADLQSIDDNQPSSSSLKYTTQTITKDNKGPTLQYKCQYCKYTFTTKKALLKHMTKWHRKYKQTNLPFKCEHCNRSFQTKTGLSCHLKTHDKSSQFQCPICPLSLFRESLYVAHVMLHESETCFPCQVCAKIFATNEERVSHYQPHITERPFGCDVCYRRFYHHHFLRSHMKSHGVYFCNFCPQRFNSTEAIQKPYVCGNCEKLPDIKSTAEHQRSLKSKKHVFESDEEETTKKTSTSIGQKSQKQVNKEIIKVIYVNEQTEDNHEEGSDTISCYASNDECEENLTDLESHVLTHESDSCFPCQVCGKVYNSHEDRLQHWETHAEDKPFVCHFCKRRFKQQQYLTNHMKTHCQYQCNFCSKEFNSPEVQSPPYACSSCVDLPKIKQKIEQLNKTHALKRDQNCVLPTQQTTAECNEPRTAIDRQAYIPQEQLSSEVDGKNVSQVVYVKNEAVEKTEYESNNETNIEILQVNDSDSCYSPNEDDNDDTDFESTDDNEASGSKSKRKSQPIDLTSLQCPYCPAAFKSKLYTTRHIIRNHSRKLPIKCRKCQRGFFNEFGLKVHLKSHDNIHCPICKSVLVKNFFITHVLTHENETCFPCQVCGKIFNSQNDRKRHWESHAKEKPFACNICYRRYSKLNRLTRHLKVHNQHNCSFCSISFNSSETLRAPPYVCPKCEKLPDIKQKINDLKTFMYNSENTITASNTPGTSSLNIKPVSEDVHDDEADKTTEEDSNIEFTDKTTKTLTIPIHINTNAPAHKCQYCERDFYSKLGLDMHIRQSHINNSRVVTSKHKCQQCHKDFRSSSSLSHHMKTHDKKNQFQCPVCPTRKFGESTFIVHVMLHENESCFPCQVCGKIFKCNEERMTHWKCHIKEKPHGCKICFRRFGQKHILQRHMKVHSQQMDV